MVARANKNTLHRSSVALDKWSPASACDVQLPLHFTLTTFLLVHKYCSLHGGLCARYSHWPSACLWLLPFLLSSSSPHCRWLVTNGAVNYSGWAGIKYERGAVCEARLEKEHTHIHTQMIVFSYARQLHIFLLLLPPCHLQIVLSIIPVSCFYFYVCRCTLWSKHVTLFSGEKKTFVLCICLDNKRGGEWSCVCTLKRLRFVKIEKKVMYC